MKKKPWAMPIYMNQSGGIIKNQVVENYLHAEEEQPHACDVGGHRVAL